MNFSTNLYINNSDTKNKFNIIKQLGYDEFFTGINEVNETMTLKEQMEYATSLGLKCTMIHCFYEEYNLNCFWEKGKEGRKIALDYISQIKSCYKYTKNFVVHLNNSKDATVSKIGLKRIKKILKVCKKYDINLCIENLYSEIEIPYVFKNISNPYLKICYDTGHRNFLTPNFNVPKLYGKYISVLHIHENDGTKDQHKKLTNNSNVFLNLIEDLSFLNKDIVISSEVKYPGDDLEIYLKENLQTLNSLVKKCSVLKK